MDSEWETTGGVEYTSAEIKEVPKWYVKLPWKVTKIKVGKVSRDEMG